MENYKLADESMNELQHILPRISNILNTTIDNLNISINKPCNFGIKGADNVVALYGLTPYLPYIQEVRKHSASSRKGTGITLYQCLNNNLKYIIYNTYNFQGGLWSLFICKKGEQFQIIRHGQKICNKNNEITKPILKEGLLDDIIKNSIYFLLHKRSILSYGVKIKRGIILDGPPGNGKTMTCKYIKHLCNIKNISCENISSSQLESAYQKDELDSIFNSYPVVFFDDIDISYFHRDCGNGKMACAILSAMDGIHREGKSIRIFTTNEKINDLDEAFIRPGRIDKKFTFDKPNTLLREKLILSWNKGIKLNSQDVDLLVKHTEGNSFAELESIKSDLVINFLMNKNWDIYKAIDNFENREDSLETKNKTLGFNN